MATFNPADTWYAQSSPAVGPFHNENAAVDMEYVGACGGSVQQHREATATDFYSAESLQQHGHFSAFGGSHWSNNDGFTNWQTSTFQQAHDGGALPNPFSQPYEAMNTEDDLNSAQGMDTTHFSGVIQGTQPRDSNPHTEHDLFSHNNTASNHLGTISEEGLTEEASSYEESSSGTIRIPATGDLTQMSNFGQALDGEVHCLITGRKLKAYEWPLQYSSKMESKRRRSIQAFENRQQKDASQHEMMNKLEAVRKEVKDLRKVRDEVLFNINYLERLLPLQS